MEPLTKGTAGYKMERKGGKEGSMEGNWPGV